MIYSPNCPSLYGHYIFDSVSVRVNIRQLRLFPINHRGPVYTVREVLEGETEEFRTLQRFIFKDCGKDMQKSTLKNLLKSAFGAKGLEIPGTNE